MATFTKKQSLYDVRCPVARAGAIAVYHDGFIYAGFGATNWAETDPEKSFPADLYKYDCGTNKWTTIVDASTKIYGHNDKKHLYQLRGREGAFAFCINKKIYFGMGNWSNFYLLDFWCYNPAEPDLHKAFTLVNLTGTAGMPSISGVPGVQPMLMPGRQYPFSCSIGNHGYFGTGRHADDTHNQAFVCVKDFWSFDGVMWQSFTEFPQPVCQAFCFVIDKTIYVGGGEGDTAITDAPNTNFYSFNASLWTPQPSLPNPGTQQATAAFAIGHKGYYLQGINDGTSPAVIDKVYSFDSVLRLWTLIDILQNEAIPFRNYEIGVAAPGGPGYVGLGGVDQGPYYNDFWSFH